MSAYDDDPSVLSRAERMELASTWGSKDRLTAEERQRRDELLTYIRLGVPTPACIEERGRAADTLISLAARQTSQDAPGDDISNKTAR